MLDARGVISVSERASYINKIRALVKNTADIYLKQNP
jgi:glycyl-tRNA synthetase alpha subunit